MKMLTLLALLLASVSSFAASVDTLGNCSLLSPNQQDRNGVYCKYLGKYAVLIKGYFASSQCYDYVDARAVLKKLEGICTAQDTAGEFRILYSGHSDVNDRHCASTGKFAVLHNGSIVDNKCYDLVDAFNLMWKLSRL